MDILLQILLLLIAAKLLGELVEQGGYPALIGEISAGILLGPALLNVVVPNPTLEVFSNIGIIALLFISGVEIHLKSFIKSEKAALSTAIAGVAIPFASGLVLGALFSLTFFETLFIAIALSITSIGISVRTLIDLKRLTTSVGTTTVGAAVIDDIFGILLLAVLSSLATSETLHLSSLLIPFLLGVGFLVFYATAGRKAIVWLFERARRSETHEMVYSTALIIALLSAYLSFVAGLHYAIGAFIAGLILGKQIRRDRLLFDSLMDFGFGFFVTLFFASIGLLVTFAPTEFPLLFIIPLVLFALLGKILGGFIGALPFMDRGKALMVGIGIAPRGEITLIVAKVTLATGIITSGLFSAVTVMVIATIFITPLLMKRGFEKLGDTGI